MRAFVVRPVMIGLLALILAGWWGSPLGTRGGGPIAQPACPSLAVRLLHHGSRC